MESNNLRFINLLYVNPTIEIRPDEASVFKWEQQKAPFWTVDFDKMIIWAPYEKTVTYGNINIRSNFKIPTLKEIQSARKTNTPGFRSSCFWTTDVSTSRTITPHAIAFDYVSEIETTTTKLGVASARTFCPISKVWNTKHWDQIRKIRESKADFNELNKLQINMIENLFRKFKEDYNSERINRNQIK